jgi:hypothetical protein
MRWIAGLYICARIVSFISGCNRFQLVVTGWGDGQILGDRNPRMTRWGPTATESPVGCSCSPVELRSFGGSYNRTWKDYPHTSVPSLGTTPKADNFHTQWSNNFLDVDSLKVINFQPPPSLIPEWHRTSLRCIRTGPHDTMAPSTITWIPIHRRLGTRRLGTVILCITFVD